MVRKDDGADFDPTYLGAFAALYRLHPADRLIVKIDKSEEEKRNNNKQSNRHMHIKPAIDFPQATVHHQQ